jgi:uncharacterized protein
MQFQMGTDRPARIVTGYGPSFVRVGAREFGSSVIVTADQVLPWPVADVGELTPELLEPVLALGVEVVLLATGARQTWPDPTVIAHAARRRVGLEVMEIGAACRTFNVLVADRRAVALAALLGRAG